MIVPDPRVAASPDGPSDARPDAPALGLPAQPARPVPDVRRIAVLRANGIGDYVVAEPALSSLRDAYPDAEITLLGARHHEALLAGRPSPVDRVVTVPLVPGVRVGPDPDASEEEVEAWCAERRAEGYDLAVQLHGGGRNSNKLLLRLGAKVTVGAATPDAPRPDRWVPYWPYQHDTVRWLEVAAAAGATTSRIEPHLAVTEADLAASRAVVPPGDAPLLVVHPGATDARRCYPEERLGAVAQDLADLADHGARVVVAGGPSEADRVARVVSGMRDEPETAVGTLDLPGLVGLLSRATMVLGNDSGPRHLAGAVGTPTVAVFTYANLADVAPLTRTWHRVLVSWHGGCQVCGRRVLDGWCGHEASATHDVPVEEVREAALDLWGQAVT
ncbi:glycosyltransferase family 9 protein [Actinomycetospora straminea]|uniref:Glycosyltransferase family 9 protein n=1 Tax=Actinomycetospora straminea TaxID=663607 RepID=A0ABP9DUD1_9PSEU|nr:glycosyltransferase family 9 protein [Actinomycetospora straminea]MDD7936293.1 glycosyltransferase family 9 protein [Actinomycetospora straminea]